MQLMINNSCRDLLGAIAQILAAEEHGTELPPVVLQHWDTTARRVVRDHQSDSGASSPTIKTDIDHEVPRAGGYPPGAGTRRYSSRCKTESYRRKRHLMATNECGHTIGSRRRSLTTPRTRPCASPTVSASGSASTGAGSSSPTASGPIDGERRYSRATHGLSRLVVLSSAGTVGLDALRWCAGVGIGVVVLDPFGGELHLTSGGVGNDDPRLRRAQALAMATPAGFEATRYLIASKLAGQASVAKGRLSQPSAAETIVRLRDELEDAETLEAIRHVEAVAANVYWNVWSGIEVPFVRKDVARTADHWRVFEGRRSAVNVGTSRSATDPANALLNYGYRLLEAEGRLACLAVGLDPGLGILHADLKGRDSMVLDVMEAVRPVVDGYVLDLFRARPLMKTDFAEDRRGVLRVLPPLTHRIAEAMPAWGLALGPVVEHVAQILSTSSPYDVSVPSVLTPRQAQGGSGAAGHRTGFSDSERRALRRS